NRTILTANTFGTSAYNMPTMRLRVSECIWKSPTVGGWRIDDSTTNAGGHGRPRFGRSARARGLLPAVARLRGGGQLASGARDAGGRRVGDAAAGQPGGGQALVPVRTGPHPSDLATGAGGAADDAPPRPRGRGPGRGGGVGGRGRRAARRAPAPARRPGDARP